MTDAAPSRVTFTSIVAAFSLFAATAIGQIIELVLKGTNPDDVDVTDGLAYLRPILISTLVLVVIGVIVTVLAIRRLAAAEGAAATRLPWTLFGAQVVLWLIVVAVRAALGPIIDG